MKVQLLALTVFVVSAFTVAAKAEEPYVCNQFRQGIAQRQKSYNEAKKWQQWDKAANDLKAIGRLQGELKKFNCK